MMNRRDFLKTVGVTGAFAMAGRLWADAPTRRRRPNFIVILADDLGYGDLGCYGNQIHKTPRIDRMAAEGIRFTDFYVASPICTPSRVALLTGRYPLRAGLTTLLWPTSTEGLPSGEVTIAEALKTVGYATACIGKWHLGHHRPDQLPMSHGFDSWFGMPYPNDMDGQHPQTAIRQESWPPLPLYRNEKIVEQPVDVNWLTQKYTAEALRFLREHRDQPFFLYLAHAMPHTYLGASPEFHGQSQNGLYGDAVQELDWSVGQVLATLRELRLEQDTLVIFTSDNGAALRKPNAKTGMEKLLRPDGTYGSNHPLRGGKQSTSEGGVRVPGICWWPGNIPAGQVVPEPAITLDVLPTLLELTGATLPGNRIVDGRTIVPVLRATGHRDPTDLYFGDEMLTACRSGRWKLQMVLRSDQKRGDRPGKALLFDLEKDMEETTDLADQHPDIVRQLQSQMQAAENAMRP